MEAKLNRSSAAYDFLREWALARIRVGTCLLLGSLIASTGCSTAQKRGSPHPQSPNPVPTQTVSPHTNGTPSPNEPYGPPEPAPSPTPESPEAYGPAPIQIRPVVLVFGPGMARGFAYIGVLRALNEEKIPVGAVLGTEMGALIGSLYAMDGNINRFEWALLRFKDELFAPPKSVITKFFKTTTNARKFESALMQVFGDRKLSDAKIPFRVTIQSQESGAAWTLLHEGSAVRALRTAAAMPSIFTAGDWNGVPAISAEKSRAFPVAEAKAMGIGPVIVFDTRGTGTPDPVDFNEADLVIRPDLKGIGPNDFQKRTEAAFRGKKAVIQNRDQIRQLAGLPKE